ncbi:hypothetical protein RvY_05842 [Ramazzottius varieornatus]|uniref:Rab-GAP TBC domain-containing protein n=1 Tax=Ramazzottius varieornatus TaxID=947166 RepID=A0A1D1V5D2_RAMVA|nr:hypothetical protein RvY_05842 [Ramazzottius varieornatus]
MINSFFSFSNRLFWKATKESNKGFYKVINLESQSQREGRFPSVLPALDASSSEDETADSDSDEQMLSGSGRVSRECEEGELKVWSEILTKWRTNLAVRPKYLNSIIRRDGIPQSLRCEVWQNLAGCFNSDELLEKYKSLSVQDSPWESEITKDISRTFPAHEFFKEAGSEGQDQLFRVIKAYSIYDPETGYSQSLSFIAATILLQMPEENAFCLFVRVMENYGVREMMRNDFEGTSRLFLD